jgi:hypothetical protein
LLLHCHTYCVNIICMDLVLLWHDSVKKARSWSVLCEEVTMRLQCRRTATWMCMPEHFEEQDVHRTLHRRSHFHNFDMLLKIFTYVNKVFWVFKNYCLALPVNNILHFLKENKMYLVHTAARNTSSSGIYMKLCCGSRALMHATTVWRRTDLIDLTLRHVPVFATTTWCLVWILE